MNRREARGVLEITAGEPIYGNCPTQRCAPLGKAVSERSIPDQDLWGDNRRPYLGGQVVAAGKLAIDLLRLTLAEIAPERRGTGRGPATCPKPPIATAPAQLEAMAHRRGGCARHEAGGAGGPLAGKSRVLVGQAHRLAVMHAIARSKDGPVDPRLSGSEQER